MPRTLEEAEARIKELEAVLEKHPAARLNRIVHLGVFLLGALILCTAALGITFGEAEVSVTLHWMIGLLLIAPETLGKVGATEALKAFASSFGSAAGAAASRRRNRGNGDA